MKLVKVSRERDAVAVLDCVTDELVAHSWPLGPWSLSKSKWLRENGTGHKCIYLGFEQEIA